VNVQGRVLRYDVDNIDTDVIWPGKYTYVQMGPEEMARHAMETFDPDFPRKVKGFTILAVGRNFGCGSSREQASECLKHSGIKAVVAKSFARIFYRNSINLGLPVIESPEAVETLATGDAIAIELTRGSVLFEASGREISVPQFPPYVMELIRHDGLINYIRSQSGRRSGA
jgi:3-isopropylmalate/(R)-2-methylmalate dehydratase small subunit